MLGTTPEIVRITPNIPDLTFKNYQKAPLFVSIVPIFTVHLFRMKELFMVPSRQQSEFQNQRRYSTPGLVLARDFAWKLKSNGITISGNATDEFVVSTAERRVIYTHFSPKLSEIIKEINVTSNNHYAEHLFRHLALQKGKPATSTQAVQTIKAFWKSKGLPADELFMYDGSGLSPVNAVSANFFISLLSYMDKSKNAAVFRASLPISGKSGTLKNFLKGTSLDGKVQAKSGTISRVRAYSGYINTQGKQLVFAVIVNNPNSTSTAQTRKKIEEFLINVAK